MDLRTLLELILSYIQTLAWPLLVAVVMFVFRKQLRSLLTNLESAKLGGLETTFFKRAIEDPENSEETKDAVAKIWADVETTRGNPVPRQASEQLGHSRHRRGKPASAEILAAVEANDYKIQVLEALSRVGEGRLGTSSSLNPMPYFKNGMISGYTIADMKIVPVHGVGLIDVVIISSEDDPKLKELIAADSSSQPVLIVAPFELSPLGLLAARWRSPQDNDHLAEVLEAMSAFDFVKASEAPGSRA